MLGVDRRCPSESKVRRLLGKVDADQFDVVFGGFVQRLCARTSPAGRRRVLTVDGKIVRGLRRTGRDGEVPGRHVLAVIDQHNRVVLEQTAVATAGQGKSSEINQVIPLLDQLDQP